MNSLSIEEIGYFIEGNLTALGLSFLILILVMIIVASFKTITEKEAAVLIIFGKYVKTVKPGLVFVPPLIGELIVMNGTETGISLYTIEEDEEEDEEALWIDFPDGSLKPLGVKLVVEIYKRRSGYIVQEIEKEKDKKRDGSFRAAFKNDSWESFRRAAKKAAQGFVYNYLSDFDSLDKALKKKGQGFNILSDAEKKDAEGEAKELRDQLQRLGYDIKRITISGYQQDEETREGKRKVNVAKREKEEEKIRKDAEKARGEGIGSKEYNEMKAVRNIAKLFENLGYPDPVDGAMAVYKVKKAAESGQLVEGNFKIEGSSVASLFTEIGIGKEIGQLMKKFSGEKKESNEAGFKAGEDDDQKSEEESNKKKKRGGIRLSSGKII